MKRSFYIYTDGDLKRHDNTLRFSSSDGVKRDIPVENIAEIYLMSEMSFNTKFINMIAQCGIVIHFFNYYSFYTGSFYPKDVMPAGALLVKQVQHYENNEKRIFIARKLIEATADNIHRNLRYYGERGKEVDEHINNITALRKKLPNCKDVYELMGIEGNIRKIYYQSWNRIIDQEINYERREKNPPDNMINTLISFVNSLVYTRVLSEIYHTQLNPTISFLHEPGTRRFSLSLDLAEIFKPLIGDRLIFSLLNRRQITENCFTKNLIVHIQNSVFEGDYQKLKL